MQMTSKFVRGWKPLSVGLVLTFVAMAAIALDAARGSSVQVGESLAGYLALTGFDGPANVVFEKCLSIFAGLLGVLTMFTNPLYFGHGTLMRGVMWGDAFVGLVASLVVGSYCYAFPGVMHRGPLFSMLAVITFTALGFIVYGCCRMIRADRTRPGNSQLSPAV